LVAGRCPRTGTDPPRRCSGWPAQKPNEFEKWPEIKDLTFEQGADWRHVVLARVPFGSSWRAVDTVTRFAAMLFERPREAQHPPSATVIIDHIRAPGAPAEIGRPDHHVAGRFLDQGE
jgi:hypothetical protein